MPSMEYLYLTPELREAALVERRKQLENDHFRASLDREIELAKDARADVAEFDQRLADLDVDASALATVAAADAVAVVETLKR